MVGAGGDGVATVALTPGPLADIRSERCSRLLDALGALAMSPPRVLLLDALEGAGVAEPRLPVPSGLSDPAAALAAFPAPTVAVCDGPATGAGAEVLLAADVLVVGAHATMHFPEVGLGELPCWGGTQRLPRAGGIALALRMLVVGEEVDADALARTGVAIMAPDARAHASELAARLAKGAPRAQAAAREAVIRGRDLTLADGHRLESDLNLLLSTTRDRAEGIAAFFDKRSPKFEGE
ncbi:MAG TPA: enoyl-CoA hydratase-related protein [Acidimicrobiia bacterium]